MSMHLQHRQLHTFTKMPMQVKRPHNRTRTGCWTCRARRKKCDETRPHCNTCSNLGLCCEGYGFRLRWGARQKGFIANGKVCKRSTKSSSLHGRETATPSAISPSPSKFTSHSGDELLLKYLGKTIYETLTEYERLVLHDFVGWGAATLASTPNMDPEDCSEMLQACAESMPLLINCITYQITLDPKHASNVEHYYNKSLEQFRNELSNPISIENDATYYAGILLCSISMNRAMPWTIHLNGVASILGERYVFTKNDEDAKDLTTLIGTLDLPTHTLGRKTHHLHVWYNHCRFQKGVEEITGLPCTLVDLLSSIGEHDVVDRLLTWPGESGEPKQCKMWSAHCYAGIISAISWQAEHGNIKKPTCELFPISQSEHLSACSSVIDTVHNILSIMHNLRAEFSDELSPVRRALLYPLVAAGSQPAALNAPDMVFINECISALANSSLESDHYYRGIATVLQELWANGRGRTLEQVAKDLDLELALF